MNIPPSSCREFRSKEIKINEYIFHMIDFIPFIFSPGCWLICVSLIFGWGLSAQAEKADLLFATQEDTDPKTYLKQTKKDKIVEVHLRLSGEYLNKGGDHIQLQLPIIINPQDNIQIHFSPLIKFNVEDTVHPIDYGFHGSVGYQLY